MHSSSTDVRVIKLINITCGKNVAHKAKIERQTRFLVRKATGKKVHEKLQMLMEVEQYVRYKVPAAALAAF